MIKQQIKINGVDYSKYLIAPVNIQFKLDKSLDEGSIVLKGIPVKLFPQQSDVEIKLNDETEERKYEFIISNDFSKAEPVGSGIYYHEIKLVERTKLLEFLIVESISFNNPLEKNILGTQVLPINVYKEGEVLDFQLDIENTYISPLQIGSTFTIKSQYEMLTDYYEKIYNGNVPLDKIIMGGYYDNEEIALSVYVNDLKVFSTSSVETGYTIANLPFGTVTIFYGFRTYDPPYESSFYKYTFRVVNTAANAAKWTIASVIDRVLDLAEPLRYNKTTGIKDTPRYKLNEAQHEEFDLIEAPEFAFTSDTLREILNEIGEKLHAMPRLIGNEIYYDKYGGTEYATVASGALLKDCNQCVYEDHSFDINDYATTLDSTVDNLVNRLSPEEGVLTEPYLNGYKTLRSESGYIRVTDSNMIIETLYPIYEPVSLEIGFAHLGENYTIKKDITSYLYESAEYENLSSLSGGKSYAIYFTQGQNNIKGLNFKDPDPISPALQNYSIINIICEVMNIDLSTLLTNIEYPTISYRFSYIPIYTARIQQNKPYYIEGNKQYKKAYNQAANLIETRYYGENIKGAIARTGNIQSKATYTFSKVASIPKAGQLFNDDLYISVINISVQPSYIAVTIELSQNWNMLSQYIGIDSKKRYYEVSEKQSVTRISNYTDYLVISDTVKDIDNSFINFAQFPSYILQTLRQTDENKSRISLAKVYGETESNDKLPAVLLPVISSAFGNAMVFTFKYADSYSAGNTVTEILRNGISGYYQKGTQYADMYGRMEYLNFDLYSTDIAPADFATAKEIGLALPLTEDSEERGIITTGNMPIVYRKNSTEIPNINYQIEIVSDKQNYVIGSAFARNCALVSGYLGTEHKAKFYILPNRINRFSEVINISNGTEISISPIIDQTQNNVILLGFNNTYTGEYVVPDGVAGLSWVLVDGETNELLFGCNEPITAGKVISPYISFVGKIYN